MFADPFNATYDQAGAAHTEPYSLISVNGQNSVRVNMTADHEAGPTTLKISHQLVGKGANARDRHLARFECPQDVEGVPNPANVAAVYVVADIPRGSFTETQLNGMWRSIVGLLRGTNGATPEEGDATVFWDKFLAGQS
nr:MAG: coat protein [Leviviridae sp.]